MRLEPVQSLTYANEPHLGALFFRRVEELGDRTFLKLHRGERFEEISWRDCGNGVQRLLLGLLTIGRTPGDSVAIIGENCLEWVCADLATLCGGLPNVVVSPALSDRMFVRVLGHAGCRSAFVQSPGLAARLLNLKRQLPALNDIILMDGAGATLTETIGFAQLMEQGRRVGRQRLYELLESVHPNDPATIMYTSGSTGEPKGVVRTHHNLLSNISNGSEIVRARADELFIIVLSLNHLFGRFGLLKSVATGRTTAMVQSGELDFPLDLLEALAGTAMAVVPRVMERIWSALLDAGGHRRLWEQLETLDQKKSEGGSLTEDEARHFHELKATLRSAARKAFGGRIKYIAYGGAVMPPRIMRFFELVEIPLIGSYGSTECGGVTLCGIGENRPGSLGKVFPNVEIRIAEDREILIRGPTVTPGYFKDPEATREVLDAEGWFHSGDLGMLDPDGSLRLVGRKKDIFNCSDGSNIYPGYIELLLENDPLVRQAVLLGDGRPFISALLVPDRKKIAETMNCEECQLTNSEVENALGLRIERLNASLEHYEKIRKFIVLKEAFPPQLRAVTVFQKIKIDRRAVEERYRLEIAAIYQPEAEILNQKDPDGCYLTTRRSGTVVLL